MTNAPIVMAVVSDLHVGSTIGLAPPRTTLDDEGEYVSSPAQRWMWHNWLDYCKRVKEVARLNKAPYIVEINGDAVDGDHHGTAQIWTRNESVQIRTAYECLKHLVEDAAQVYVIRGTEVHVGKSANRDERVAADMSATGPSDDIHSWWHLLLDANGTTFDFAHHGKVGRLPWTKPNGANNLAGQVIINYANTGDPPPAVIIRSHFHQYVDTDHNFDCTRLIGTPGWQLATAFVHRIDTSGKVADTGGLIFTCHPKGCYDMEVKRYRAKRAKPIKVIL